MGKKAYHQISKSSNKEKPQLPCLLKVLKPQVYITKSSKFKELVQELTGNRNSFTSSPAFMEIKVAEEVVAALVNNNNVIHEQTEYQYKCKSDSSSTSSSVEAATSVKNDFTFEHHHQSENQFQISVEVSSSTDESTASPLSSYTTSCSVDQDYDLSGLQFCVGDYSLHEHSTPDELDDMFAYQEIDSFLLDNVETSSLYNCFAQIEQEVSLYDYDEFAGLM